MGSDEHWWPDLGDERIVPCVYSLARLRGYRLARNPYMIGAR